MTPGRPRSSDRYITGRFLPDKAIDLIEQAAARVRLLARALVEFRGDFGTLDELMEILTLAQTRKLDGRTPRAPVRPRYWNEIVNFETLVRHGMTSREDLGLSSSSTTRPPARRLLEARLAPAPEEATPGLAHSRTPDES